MNYKFHIPLSPIKRIFILMIFWILFISALHYYLNVYEPDIRKIKMGYMPVITNLSAPILDYVSQDNKQIRLEALKFASFADMAEAFKQDRIDAAFIIAPLSIVLFEQGIDLSVVYIGNRNESALVARAGLEASDIRGLQDKTIAVPLRYSGHNLFLHKLAYEAGINPQNLDIVEMQPPDMAAALAAGDLDAYCVGEPFAAQTLYSGESRLIYHVEDKWPNFICNLVILKNDFIRENPQLAKALTQGFVRAGFWAKNNLNRAVDILADYWNRDKEVIFYAFNNPPNHISYDQYLPKISEMQEIADLMLKAGLIEQKTDISRLINSRLCADTDTAGITLRNIFIYP